VPNSSPVSLFPPPRADQAPVAIDEGPVFPPAAAFEANPMKD
jgi:hypothetical protein